MNQRLEIVGRIDIPPSVLRHRFYLEALANTQVLQAKEDADAGVIGTWNTRECELYGWAPNVPPHRDNIGWVYGCLLDAGISTVSARPGRLLSGGPFLSIHVGVGDVFRLDDFAEHWTEDSGPRVAAFVGAFEEPCDELAIAELRRGISKLAAGAYYGAPRVRGGFRAVMDDECYVATDDHSDAELKLRADLTPAERSRLITCSQCETPAVRLDQHWPYHWEMNVCREHLQARVTRNAGGVHLPSAVAAAGPADIGSDGRSNASTTEGLAANAQVDVCPAAVGLVGAGDAS